MTTFPGSHRGTAQDGVGGDAVVRPLSRRDKLYALGLLLSLLGILLGVTLAIGGTLPIGQ